MKVYLPAWGYTSFYLLTGKKDSSDGCCKFQLVGTTQTIQTLTGGKQRSGAHTHSPVKHREEILALDIDYLARRLCELSSRDGRNDICGYSVIKGAKSSGDTWDTYGIFFLFRRGQIDSGQEEKDRYYIAITKATPSSGGGSGQQPSFKWLLLVGGSELKSCRCVELKVSLKDAGKSEGYYEHISKEVVVAPLDRLMTHPRLYVDEISYIPSENSHNLAEAGSAIAEVIYSGSQILVKSSKMYAFLPVLIHYDVKGEDPPRHIFPSARRYSLRLSLTVDEVYRVMKETMLNKCNWKASLKVLVQNTVAKSLKGLCRTYRGWIFEREISTNILGRTIIFSTPNLWKIKMLYDNIYVQQMKTYQCDANGLKSILAKWRDTILRLRQSMINKKQCPYAKDDTWINYFAECLENNDNYGGFKKCVESKAKRSGYDVSDVIFSFFEAYATWALLLGAHGLSHMLLKAVARGRYSTDYAEMIEVHLPAQHFSRVFKLLPTPPNEAETGIELDGVFRIKSHRSADIGLKIEVFDLKGLSPLDTEELLRLLENQRSSSDRCDRAFEEEKGRLERAFSVVKGSCQGSAGNNCQLLSQFDGFMKGLPEEVAPPRFMFRFLLPKIKRRVLHNQELPAKFYQYVWPRYVHSCADGCHLCVLVPGRLCAYPPSQMEFKTSKTYAIYLLDKLLEELKHSA
jgi:hypothetical protein